MATGSRYPLGYRFFRLHRGVIAPLGDSALWGVALLTAVGLGYHLQHSQVGLRMLWAVLVAAAAQCAIGYLTGLYRVRWRVGSFEEMASLLSTVVLVTGVLALVSLSFNPDLIPLGAAPVAGAMEVILAGGVRYLWRLNWERHRAPSLATERAVIFGAGEGGAQIIRALLADPESSYLPVALLDDDPSQRSRAIRHLKVAGGRGDLVRVARSAGAGTVIIAIPSARADLVKEISELAGEADLEVRVLPSVAELMRPTIGVSDIRPVTDVDLLGRRVIEIELASIAGYLTGSRILITGAGGSIGSELCRQVHGFNPAALIMLDRDESALHQVQLSIEGSALLDSRALVVCDIRDREALDAVFDEHRPQVVFHAAALKHLPLLEMWPLEAVKTNVFGTANVLEAARRYGVRRFVNVSTDKAARPTSVLGYSKRIAEGLTAEAGDGAEGRYLSVRFGNVLGSRGSAISAFRAQAEAGGPLTVTHPEVTRYFMTVEEAVRLVVQAGAIGANGEVLVLDMGAPVRVADIARLLAHRYPAAPLEIVYTGLRPGEKLHEHLFGDGEEDLRPVHPLISHVGVAPIGSGAIAGLAAPATTEQAKERLRRCCDTVNAQPSAARSEMMEARPGG